MTTWVASPAYGRTVMLGPAQRDVLDVVLRLTRNGRRPELTLGRLAELSGRPVSSVHDALGRLRALGILGVSARMGRSGGHRLWRTTARSARDLGRSPQRRAVARIMRRWYAAITQGDTEADTPDGLPDRPTASPPPRPGAPVRGDVVAPNGSATLDPFGVAPSLWEPGPPGESFGAKLRRLGLGPWIDERKHET
jgi:hypothetical protein